MEKLLPRSCLPAPSRVAPLLVEEKEQEDSFTIYESDTVSQHHSDTAKGRIVDTVNEMLHSAAEANITPASAGAALSVPATGERLFVFRDPPESCGCVDPPKRKKRKNFLNLKKGSVAPTNLP